MYVQTAPRIIPKSGQEALLKATGRYSDTFRDHMIFAVALGTALRESEIAALDCGDVFNEQGRARERIQLRTWKRSSRTLSNEQDKKRQVISIPDSLRHKLNKFRRWKSKNGQATDQSSPLFVSRLLNSDGNRKRISTRQMRRIFRDWQKNLGFDVILSFHSLRHTSLNNLQRACGDIRITNAHARHRRLDTTMIYVGPSQDEINEAVKGLQC